MMTNPEPEQPDWTGLTPSERTLRAKIAAHQSWANTADPAARTAPGRAAMMAKFERQVDPDGTMDPAERERRAASARKAYFADLARKSVQVRRERAANRKASQ